VPCTSTISDPLCSPCIHLFSSPALWTKCSNLLIEISLKSPGFIKWYPRYLNLNAAKASQSPRTWEDISDACLHLSHWGLSTSPSLNKCPFLSWFLYYTWKVKCSDGKPLVSETVTIDVTDKINWALPFHSSSMTDGHNFQCKKWPVITSSSINEISKLLWQKNSACFLDKMLG
jgi:hypothetical protein